MNTCKDKNESESCQTNTNPRWWNGRTIEIDDAGTGDLVGDAFVGFRDAKSGKIIFRSIPVDFYTGENGSVDGIKKHIQKITIDALKALKHDKEDRILLCRGSCFDPVREYFKENNIYYEPAIIVGELQDAVEGKFIQHLRNLGITSHSLTKEAGAKRYYILFNWVCQDLPNREKFVKSGFPAWKKKWRDIAIKRYEKNQKNEFQIRDDIERRAKEICEEMFNKQLSTKNCFSNR